jgi:nucleotide-binding universal stress UspA family protein
MNKIIAAFDGLKYAAATRDYSIALVKISNAHLFGVFLDDPTYTSYKIYELVADEGVSEEKMNQLDAKDKTTRADAAKDFEQHCQKAAIEYSIHHDHQVAIQDLKHESVYADLLLIGASETVTHYEEKLPTRFIRDLLVDAQCPVLLLPDQFTPIEKVVLLYDGEPSSVHAIKMFSYLLPGLGDVDTSLVSVNPPESNLHLKDSKLMKEYMKQHFPDVQTSVFKGLPEIEIVEYLKTQPASTLVVLGAYRRGAVSRWFHESLADTIMKEVHLPLFIAHNKS